MGSIRNLATGAVVALAMAAFAHNANALEVNETAGFTASADEVWQVISHFGRIEDWHPWISASASYGQDGVYYRHVLTPTGAWVVEALEAYSWADKSMSYSIVEGVFPITNYLATIRVSASGGGSVVTWTSTFDAKGVADDEAVQLIISAYHAGFESIAGLTTQ